MIQELEKCLKIFTLNPIFELQGNFIEKCQASALAHSKKVRSVRFFGGFIDCDLLFDFTTDDKQSILKISKLIRINQKRIKYIKARGSVFLPAKKNQTHLPLLVLSSTRKIGL